MHAHAAGFPVSATADLEMDILDQFIPHESVAVVECAGNEDSFAECSVAIRRNQPPAELAAVTCTGEQSVMGANLWKEVCAGV